MLIVGTKGHAVEVWQCLTDTEREGAVFFDDTTLNLSGDVLGRYPILRSSVEARAYLARTDSRFVLGLGGPGRRRQLAAQLQEWGGEFTLVMAPTAVVSPFAAIGAGLNIMHHTLIAPTATLGEGVLLNAGAAIHHDAVVGDYCEISPGARILGHCRLGYGCQIGAMAVVLPGMTIGDAAIIGAGAVVNQPVPAGTTVVGVPARRINK